MNTSAAGNTPMPAAVFVYYKIDNSLLGKAQRISGQLIQHMQTTLPVRGQLMQNRPSARTHYADGSV
ncbi:MAG: hypothetical protein HC848_00775 [Limnobacter sp.]|nr:hypothetical protein [Limnobacter sp.]